MRVDIPLSAIFVATSVCCEALVVVTSSYYGAIMQESQSSDLHSSDVRYRISVENGSVRLNMLSGAGVWDVSLRAT